MNPTQIGNLYLIPFNVGCSVIMLLVLHGTSALKVLAILSANYAIAKACRGSKAGPALTWMFNAAVLFLNERYHGYRFGDIIPGLEYLVRDVARFFLRVCYLYSSFSGYHSRSLSAVARQLQHHDAPARLVQHGLLLGLSATKPRGSCG